MDGIHEDIADYLRGHPERFVPHLMGGRLIDAEHRARYWWAASFVEGKNVLDAGCGTGYGSNILAGSGAATVTGVDRAPHVIEHARSQAEPVVAFEVGDLAALPFADDAFEVAVCFEAIEHVDAPDAALDELVRVLRPGGLLAISSPNRDIYTRSNPHHRHEYTPEELRSALSARFRHVRLQRQQDWFATAIFDDDDSASPAGEPFANGSSRKITAPEPGEETYTLALASDGPLPPPAPVVVLSATSMFVASWTSGARTRGCGESARRPQCDEERSFGQVRPGFAFDLQRTAYASCQGKGGCQKREESTLGQAMPAVTAR